MKYLSAEDIYDLLGSISFPLGVDRVADFAGLRGRLRYPILGVRPGISAWFGTGT